jgi:hypothetical protein
VVDCNRMVGRDALRFRDDVEIDGARLDHDNVCPLADVAQDGAPGKPASLCGQLVASSVAEGGRRCYCLAVEA